MYGWMDGYRQMQTDRQGGLAERTRVRRGEVGGVQSSDGRVSAFMSCVQQQHVSSQGVSAHAHEKL